MTKAWLQRRSQHEVFWMKAPRFDHDSLPSEIIIEIEVHFHPRIVDLIGDKILHRRIAGLCMYSGFITLVLLAGKDCVRVWNKSLDLLQWFCCLSVCSDCSFNIIFRRFQDRDSYICIYTTT